MKIALSITVFGKGYEWFWGNADAKYALVELSGTVLTIGISFSIKV